MTEANSKIQVLSFRNIALFLIFISISLLVPRSLVFQCWTKIRRNHRITNNTNKNLRTTNITNQEHDEEKYVDGIPVAVGGGMNHTPSRSLYIRQVQFADSIVRFDLLNAVTDRKIGQAWDGSTIILSQYGLSAANQINFEAIPSSDRVGYVTFSVTGSSYFTTTDSSRAPFALCGNYGYDYSRCYSLNLGTNKLTATPYTYSNWRWIQGYSYSITIKIVQFAPAPVPIPVKPPTLAPVKPPTLAPVKPPTLAPRKLPTLAPVKPPTLAPVKPPTLAPRKPPTNAPVKPPTVAPRKPPTNAPVKSPTVAPQKPPTLAPVKSPSLAPQRPPTQAPVQSPSNCTIPKIIGEWEQWTPYPLSGIAESLGTLIGTDFIVVSGFMGNFSNTTKQVFAYDTSNATAVWREMDEVPTNEGFHHAAYGLDEANKIMYICGSYVGGSPYPHNGTCLKYAHTNPKGQQWSFLPSLPDNGRGGGAFFYMKSSNSVLYASGATRNVWEVTDHNKTWELYLDNIAAGWQVRPDTLYQGNHISHVTVWYEGKQRHYMAGGQVQSNEANGNLDDHVEWDNVNKQWIRRTSMTIRRGHASTSTAPYGCGYLIAGGAIQGSNKTTDISYYSIKNDNWTSIGNLPRAINNPACSIV